MGPERQDEVIIPRNRPSSEAGTESSWEQINGSRWRNKRAPSDQGVDLPGMQPTEMYKQLHHEAAMASEQKKEQDTDLVTPPTRKWRSSGSPPPTRTPDNSWSGAQIIEEHEDVEASPEEPGGFCDFEGLRARLEARRVTRAMSPAAADNAIDSWCQSWGTGDSFACCELTGPRGDLPCGGGQW